MFRLPSERPPKLPRDTNLTRRGAVYYARIFVPKDLQSAMGGKTEIRPSLRTTDYAEAKRRKAALVDQWTSTFDEMRRNNNLTDRIVADGIRQLYEAGIKAADDERLARPTPDEIDRATDEALAAARESGAAQLGGYAMINAMIDVEILVGKAEWAARRRASRLARLQADLATGDTRLIETDVDAFLARKAIKLDRSGEKYRDLCHKFMRTEVEKLRRILERDRGDFTGRPQDPLVAEALELASEPETPKKTIMELFAEYEAENPNSIRPETLRQARRDVQHFASFVEPAADIDTLDKKHVREWKALLAQYPVKATETKQFEGLSLREIVAANAALRSPKPTLTRQSVRRYMANLGGFCRWLVRHGYLDQNPVIDMLPKKAAPTNKRSSFSDDQLAALFTSPLFATCRTEAWRNLHQPGDVSVRDHRYWIPWVMLFSGARPGEIAQLQVPDVWKMHDTWVMHITTEGEGGKRTKTKGSMRVVPIHSELIGLGFVDHCIVMSERGERQVFPEVVIPETGQIAAQFSREFNRYLAKVGVKVDKSLVTYSLRHTFIDRARRAGFMDEEIGLIVGHDKPTMTGRYGVEQEGVLAHRVKIVEGVQYPVLRGILNNR